MSCQRCDVEMKSGRFCSDCEKILNAAVAAVEANPKYKFHSVGIGRKNGDGDFCVQVETETKMTAQGLVVDGIEPLPPVVYVSHAGGMIPIETDVIEEPQFEAKPNPFDSLVRYKFSNPPEYFARSLVDDLKRCQQHIKSGCEIFPLGHGWVGTNGGAVIDTTNGTYGILTNSHVAGEVSDVRVASPIGQPGGNGPPFGALRRSVPVSFASNAENLVDCCFVSDDEAYKTDGRFLACIPEIAGVGPIDPRPWNEADVRVGLAVQKVGRTTGYTTGKIVRVGNTSQVGYEKGTARFVRQFVIQGDGGAFSQPGDSGSLIVDMDQRPVAHLYAGGGGTTLGNPIEFTMQLLKIKFFK